ncbi:MAG: UvrD-helicase domain-containing protein [Acidobacteriota bacterium]|nr:UvrD-helicase domain-containing protein [Acidobacteriota bacterium]
MQFRIADTFTDSLAKLTGDEQKAVKTTAFDLQMDPARPGLQLHQVEGAKDKGFWSVRVSRDIRLIVHRTASSFLLCYVDHHHAAYQWAERRRLERHPTTGAAQLVEICETVREIPVPRYVEVDVPAAAQLVASGRPAAPREAIFGGASDDYLLGYGVPAEWLGDVRAATEDTLLDLADHLPAEAAEALLQIATGGAPALPPAIVGASPSAGAAAFAQPAAAAVDADAFDHPDAQRRFRVMADVEALERVLDYPWEKWTVFLHPAQRQLIERKYNGPARVSGSAGTGKTIVALHRAVHLARRHPESRVLLATFSDALATALRVRLTRLIGNEPKIAERLEVHAMGGIGRRLYAARAGRLDLAGDEDVRTLLDRAAAGVEGHRFSARFLWTEWSTVVDAWQLETWEDYRDVPRLGRRTRLAEKQREVLWSIFSRVRSALADEERLTEPAMFTRLAAQIAQAPHPPFDFCVIDEAQDVGVAELRLLAALGGGRPNGLFFAGDLGQRIFQTPFSWRSLGVDVRGRSHTLRINYRTSHQIRRQADRLLPPELADVDGNAQHRGATVSVFNGPAPELAVLDSPEEETEAIAAWLRARKSDGYAPQAIGVFVRSEAQVERALSAVRAAGMRPAQLDTGSCGVSGSVAVGTMHLAKGLEFRAVAVAACDDEVIPLQGRIEHVADEAGLEEVYSTERHLLYVACTRARDRLLVTGIEPASEFLDDLRG